MGDKPAPTPQETTAAQLQAFIQYLPELTRVVSEQILPSEQAKLAATKEIAPQVAELQNDLFNQYGVPLAETAGRIEGAGVRGRAEAEADILGGGIGEDIIRASVALQGLLDPEFVAGREAVGRGIAKNVEALGYGDLTGSEVAAMERAINRGNVARGINDTPTPGSTLRAASEFGNASTQKKLALSQALTGASQGLQSLRFGVDPTQATLGRPSQSANLANTQFAGIQQPQIGSSALALGQSFLSETGATARQANDINANTRDWIDRVNEGFSAVGSLT